MAFNYNEELKDASLLINFGGTFLQAYEFLDQHLSDHFSHL